MSTAYAKEPIYIYTHVPMTESHNIAVGYIFWLIGFTGAHRFYYGRQVTGIIWFFTLGLLGIGWIVDAFLIPSMQERANREYMPGRTDYSLTWLLFMFLGIFGVHRLYMGKWITAIIYFLTGGLLGIGWIYDLFTLNEQVDDLHRVGCC
jgi:TM2 domain-containing membrane protein YozV